METTQRNLRYRRMSMIVFIIGWIAAKTHAWAPVEPLSVATKSSTCSAPVPRHFNVRLSMETTANAETDTKKNDETAAPQQDSPAPQPAVNTIPRTVDHLRGKDDIYSLSNPIDLKVLLFQYPKDQIIALKIHAPWCKTCKVMAPKYRQLSKKKSLNKVVFADFTNRDHPTFVKEVLEVNALPTILLFRAPSSIPLSAHPFGTRDKIQAIEDQLQVYLKENEEVMMKNGQNGDDDNDKAVSSRAPSESRMKRILLKPIHQLLRRPEANKNTGTATVTTSDTSNSASGAE